MPIFELEVHETVSRCILVTVEAPSADYAQFYYNEGQILDSWVLYENVEGGSYVHKVREVIDM
jgi:hypothetical protein